VGGAEGDAATLLLDRRAVHDADAPDRSAGRV
jgi:hypothetical protein